MQPADFKSKVDLMSWLREAVKERVTHERSAAGGMSHQSQAHQIQADITC